MYRGKKINELEGTKQIEQSSTGMKEQGHRNASVRLICVAMSPRNVTLMSRIYSAKEAQGPMSQDTRRQKGEHNERHIARGTKAKHAEPIQ